MNPITLPAPRVITRKLKPITLGKGNHRSAERGLCVMEAAAFIAGLPHSDHPSCVCPIITKFMMTWNDDLPTNEDRDRLLKPLIPVILNTRGTRDLEKRRALLIDRWYFQVFTPAWLDAASLAAEAASLRAASDIASPEFRTLLSQARDAAQKKEAAAWDAARAAARAAAWDAARAAAWDAAWDAARAAAWDAARAAAWDAARAAAWDAARAAAWDAARAAAWDAAKKSAADRLAPIVADLQKSASALIRELAALT
jgi:hypothetical protein